MKKYYSKSTGGFYCSEIHGERVMKEVYGDGISFEGHEKLNPDCLIPIDAVEISDSDHAALLAGQSSGKRITADVNGRPELIDPPAPTADEIKAQNNAAIQLQINNLEKGQARAVREAALNIEGAVDRLKALDQKIRALAGGFVK
jgi:hypothetical protein